jgi:hypothetical protein
MYSNTFAGDYSDLLYISEIRNSPSSSSAGAIIVRITYGYEAQEQGDPIITLAESTVARFSDFSEPGAYLVDFIPVCRSISCSWYQREYLPTHPVKYVPDWFPGAGFKKEASETKSSLQNLVDIPFQFALREMVLFPEFQMALDN